MDTLFTAQDTWALMAITLLWVSFSIYAEQKWEWAKKISGAIIALLGAMALSNARIIPTSSLWFDTIIWSYVIPISIPLLLFNCNIKKIFKESGRLLGIFLLGSFATAIAALLAYLVFKNYINEAASVSAIMSGSYIGGGVNFAALAQNFNVDGKILAATTVADNLMMAIYFFTLLFIANNPLFKKLYKHTSIEKKDNTNYWEAKPISIFDISMNLALSVLIVYIAEVMSKLVLGIESSSLLGKIIIELGGNKYVLITTISLIIATVFSTKMEKINGSKEIGTFLIYLFLFTIGVPASLSLIITKAPLLLALCAFIIAIHMVITFIFGKIFKFSLEEIILASNANIGGPTTAAAFAISQGWNNLIAPCVLVGTLGYIIGTYTGTLIGILLGV